MTTTIIQNGFLPTQISGCQLWFDAADRTSMTFSGSTVTQWNDKSGNGRNATNGGYVAPTYSATAFNGGYAGLLFNGSSSMLNTAALLPTPVLSSNGTDTTIFVVFNYTGPPPSGGYGLYGLGSQANTYVTRTPWNAGGAAGGAIIDTASATGSSRIVAQFASVNPAQLYSIFRSGASHYFYQFGSLSASNLSSSGTVGTTSQTFSIGGGIADTTFFNSYISEIVIYNIALTAAQRQQVEGYLAWKWGLQANLPPTHPYKNTPAVIITQSSTLAVLNTTNLLNNAAFLPTSIPGCQIWLDGADPAGTGIAPVNGASISTWADKSGNAKSATATSGNATFSAAALNGRGVLAFGGAAYLTSQLTMGSTAPLTYFAVARPNVTTSFYAVSAINGGPTNVRPNTLMLYKAYNDYWWFSGGTGAVDGNTVTLLSSTSRYDINANYWSPSYTQMNINGTSYASSSAAPTSLANGGTFLVGIASGLYEYWNGWIAELIIYNSALTTNQRQQIEGYLAWKWGLQANLPATHPYKAAPFSPFSAVASVASLLNTNQLNSKLITSMFNPKNITGCQIWFDGADPLGTGSAPSNATTISTWADKSGNARNATATGTPTYSEKILNGIGAPLLSGSTSYFTTPSFIPSPTGIPSIFIVMRQTSYVSGNSDFFLASDYRVIDLLGQGNNYNAALTIGNSAQTPLTAINATLNPTLLSVIVTSGVGGVGYANGTYAATTGSSGGSLASSYVYYIGGGPGFIGYIYEVMMYNSSLSTAQRQQVEGYLAWKWGLQANLPSTHPYKILPPPPN